MLRFLFFLILIVDSFALPLSPEPRQILCPFDDSCVPDTTPQSQPAPAPAPTPSGGFVAFNKRHEVQTPTLALRSVYPTFDSGDISGLMDLTPDPSEHDPHFGDVFTVNKQHVDDLSKDDNNDDVKSTHTSVKRRDLLDFSFGAPDFAGQDGNRRRQLSKDLLDYSFGGPDFAGQDGNQRRQLNNDDSSLIQRRQFLDISFGAPDFAGQDGNRRRQWNKDDSSSIQRRDLPLAHTASVESVGQSPVPYHKRQSAFGGWAMPDVFSSGLGPKPEVRSVPYAGHISAEGMDVEAKNQEGQLVHTPLPAVHPPLGRRRVKHQHECCHHQSHCSKEEIKQAECHHKATPTTKKGHATTATTPPLSPISSPTFSCFIPLSESGVKDPNILCPDSERDQVPSTTTSSEQLPTAIQNAEDMMVNKIQVRDDGACGAPTKTAGQELIGVEPTHHADQPQARSLGPC